MYYSAYPTTESNMVAIDSGQKQLTGALKDEFSKWMLGLAKYKAAIKALGLEKESKADNPKGKITTVDPK